MHRAVPRRQVQGPGGGTARAGRHSGPGLAHGRVSAPDVGWHEPARDDRHGDRLQPAPADRRRTHDGARRDHPEADPRPAGQLAARARHGAGTDHARHGRGRRDRAARAGDVCRPDGRGGADRRAVRRPAPSVYGGAAGSAARTRHRPPPPADNSGHGSRYRRPAERLPVQPALPLCHRCAAWPPSRSRMGRSAAAHAACIRSTPPGSRPAPTPAPPACRHDGDAGTRAAPPLRGRRRAVRAIRPGAGGGRRVVHADAPARPWRSSANPAPASPRSRASRR